MADIYEELSNTYEEKVTKKTHYTTLTLPEISLEGAVEFTIGTEYEYRPDLISLASYGSSELDDFITVANQMTDPIKDYAAGTKIYIPSPDAIAGILG